MSFFSRSALFFSKYLIPLSLPFCVLRDGPKRLSFSTFQGLVYADFRPSTLSAEDENRTVVQDREFLGGLRPHVLI
jgi:hypothetical protein